MTDITIILPLPSYSEAQDAAYVRTIESIKKLVDVTPTIIAVGDAASNNHLKTLLPTEWDTTLLNVKNTTLQYEVGKAVKEVKTDYFSVIELGDEYLHTWFTHVSKEIELNEPNTFQSWKLSMQTTWMLAQSLMQMNQYGHLLFPKN